MGITGGWISAEVDVTELAEAMLRAWEECEVVRSLEGAGLDILYEQGELARAQERELDQALSVWGFIQVGERSVCIDPHAVTQERHPEMSRLSRIVGPTLGLTLVTVGGTAGFAVFEDGQCVRRVWYCDGKTEATGTPIDEEEGIDVSKFYWDECEALWDAFGLGKLGVWNGPLRVLVIRDQSVERELRARQVTERTLLRRKSWWKFW